MLTNIVDAVEKARGVEILDMTLRDARREFEAHYFSRLLLIHQGNVAKVAEISGISVSGAIYRKLTDLGLTPEVRRKSI